VPGVTAHVPEIETESRTRDKAQADYGGDYSQVLDVVRMSFACDSLKAMKDLYLVLLKEHLSISGELFDEPVCLAELEGSSPHVPFGEVLRVKNRVVKGIVGTGYRDLLLNVSVNLKNEGDNCCMYHHIIEIQIHHKRMLQLKVDSHRNHEIIRMVAQLPEDKASLLWGLVSEDNERQKLHLDAQRTIQQHITEVRIWIEGIRWLSEAPPDYSGYQVRVICRSVHESKSRHEFFTPWLSSGLKHDWNYGPEVVECFQKQDLSFKVEIRLYSRLGQQSVGHLSRLQHQGAPLQSVSQQAASAAQPGMDRCESQRAVHILQTPEAVLESEQYLTGYKKPLTFVLDGASGGGFSSFHLLFKIVPVGVMLEGEPGVQENALFPESGAPSVLFDEPLPHGDQHVVRCVDGQHLNGPSQQGKVSQSPVVEKPQSGLGDGDDNDHDDDANLMHLACAIPHPSPTPIPT